MKTNSANLEHKFDNGDDVLDFFETEVILNIERLSQLSEIINISALARKAGLKVQTLQGKIRRKTPLSGSEIKALIAALKQYNLTTVGSGR
ncbi:MAG TPA: hypothetical protein EYQ50_04735 [Verrucomicrobiales bacterium]|jgi:hypothetical protein|nr:hypothetical protein [Verrucomicrobiales bacterium]